jgi:hypothetical protein
MLLQQSTLRNDRGAGDCHAAATMGSRESIGTMPRDADGSEGWAGTQPEAISSPPVSAIPASPGFNDPPDLVLSFPPNIFRLGT